MGMFELFQTSHISNIIWKSFPIFWALEKKAISYFVSTTIMHVKVCPLSCII